MRLGEVVLVAHHTPGHTRGATTWETTLVDVGRAYKVVWPDGGGFNPGYRIGKEPMSYPGSSSRSGSERSRIRWTWSWA